MDIFNHYTTQHLDSVAFVFKKYGITAPPTRRNLQLAILAGKDTQFYQDLVNATTKRSLGHSNYEDDFNYYLLDMSDDSFDGEVIGIVDSYELDYADRSAKKAARKQKKVVRKAKKQAKKDQKSAGRSADVAEAEVVDENGGGGLTVGEKIEKAFSTVGSLATAAGGIAGQFINRGSSSDSSAVQPSSGEYLPDGSPAPENSMKKYMPYIIGGVALVAVLGALIFFLKRKK